MFCIIFPLRCYVCFPHFFKNFIYLNIEYFIYSSYKLLFKVYWEVSLSLLSDWLPYKIVASS